MRGTHLRGLMVSLAVFVFGVAMASDAAPVMSPEESLAELKAGNKRFITQQASDKGDLQVLRTKLATEGQHPIAAIIACADSRVPVEVLFDQPIGGVFVIKAAGNTADVQSGGSVQYAVEHLNVPVVLVMGHTKCGAVNAVIAGEHATGNLERMLEPIAKAVGDVEDALEQGAAPERTVTVANIKRAMETLKEEDEVLAKRVEEGEVLLLGAVYDIQSGVVEWLD